MGTTYADYLLYGFENKRIFQCSQYISKMDMRQLQGAMMRAQSKNHSCIDVELVENKLAFFEKCASSNIQTPEILAIISETNSTVSPKIPVISNKESLSAFLNSHNNKLLYLKLVDGVYGKGSFSVKVKNREIYNHLGIKISLEDILSHCSKYSSSQRLRFEQVHGNFLIQEYLTPHKKLKSLMLGPGLGTFRVITFLQENKTKVTIPYALVKIPLRGNITDNFEHGKSGNLLCGVDIASGQLVNAWGKRKNELSISSIERHPETQLAFKGFLVPCWDELLSCIKRTAKVFSEYKSLGWDVAITDRGIYVIEANCWYDIDLTQIALERGIKSEIHRLSAD